MKRKLSKLQIKALSKAMQADQQQWFSQILTPDRGYGYPMDHVIRVVEMILRAKHP